MFDFDDPRYRPLWLRLLLCGVCVGWGIFELASGNFLFAILFIALSVYLIWRLLFNFHPRDEE